MDRYEDVLHDLRQPTVSLRHAIPDTWGTFVAFHQQALADGVVPASVKETVALAISVVKRCDGCIAFHARAAARAGATPEQVAELLGVALLMDGGPATVYGPRAWEAFHHFRGEMGSAPVGGSP